MEKTFRWQFSLDHIAGKKNCSTDALSRFPWTEGALAEFAVVPDSVPEVEGECFSVDLEEVAVTMEEVREASAQDSEIQKVLALIQETRHHSAWSEVKGYVRHRAALWEESGALFLGRRAVIPVKLRKRCLQTLHSAHQGVTGMMARARETIWWPGIAKDVEELRETCRRCTESAPSQPAGQPSPVVSPLYPFQMIVADLFDLRGIEFVVVADRFSGWCSVARLNRTNAGEVINVLRRWFMDFGVPENLTTDGGLNLVASQMKEFLQKWGVKQHVTPAYFPHSNLRAETAVKTVKRLLGDNLGPGGTLHTDKVVRGILQHRNTPLRDLQLSPAQLVFAREMRDALPGESGRYVFRKEWMVAQREREQAGRQRLAQDLERWSRGSRELPPLSVGSSVLVQNQVGARSKAWEMSGTVVEREGETYLVKMDGSGRISRRKRQFLRLIRTLEDRGRRVRDHGGDVARAPDGGQEHQASGAAADHRTQAGARGGGVARAPERGQGDQAAGVAHRTRARARARVGAQGHR